MNNMTTEPKETSQGPQGEAASQQKKVFLYEGDLAALKEKSRLADEHKDKLLRLQADIDNINKRRARDKVDFIKFANEALLFELLDVLDNFDRAVSAAKNSQDSKTLLQGVEMIALQIQDFLKQKGVRKIECAGGQFDPAKHEAVEHVYSEKHMDNTVLEELRKGYTIEDRVLRHAVVKVSTTKKRDGDVSLGDIPQSQNSTN